MRKLLACLIAISLSFSHTVWAQTQEELDKRHQDLDAQIKAAEAKAAAAAKADAAAAEAEAARKAKLNQRPPPPPVIVPARSTLIVQSDADCALSVDVSSQGVLKANQPKSLQVVPGEQLIRCVSSANPEQAVELVKTVLAGTKQVVKLELAVLLKPKVDVSVPATVFSDKLKDGSQGPDMVVIPAGSFMMDSPQSEDDRSDDEGPQHRVNVPAFAMGKTEVTVAQFRKFVNASGYRSDAEKNTDVAGFDGTESGCYSYNGSGFAYTAGSSWRKPGFAQGDAHPVVCLSFNDAEAYVKWLAAQTGKRYRLPSEAQHEYAVRAGSASRFAWGSDADAACTVANVSDQTTKAKFPDLTVANCSDGFVYTSSASSFQANSFGLYDTVGNAWEWIADCWNENYTGAPTDGSVWATGDCKRRVLRGAGWFGGAVYMRAAVRDRYARASRFSSTSLRLIQDL